MKLYLPDVSFNFRPYHHAHPAHHSWTVPQRSQSKAIATQNGKGRDAIGLMLGLSFHRLPGQNTSERLQLPCPTMLRSSI